MMALFRASILSLNFFFALFCFSYSAFAQQTPGSRNTNQNIGNRNVFSYSIQSTYGTSTSSQVTGNMRAETEALLKLKSGSKVVNKVGDDSGNTSAVFIATPNGGNVNLRGITGENLFLIDDGTFFRSRVYTQDTLIPGVNSTGSASATATHATNVVVEKSNTSFTSTFEQTF